MQRYNDFLIPARVVAFFLYFLHSFLTYIKNFVCEHNNYGLILAFI